MHALARMAQAMQQARYLDWAVELANTAHAALAHARPGCSAAGPPFRSELATVRSRARIADAYSSGLCPSDMTMETPLHPALVHLPLALSLVVPLLLLAVWLGRARLGWVRTTLALPVALQALLFAGAMVSMNTGEDEEERVENRVPHAAIEKHEDLAGAFTWAAGTVLAVLSLGALLSTRRAGRMLCAIAGAGSLAVAGLGLAAGHAGGDLVYVHGAAGVAASGEVTPLHRDDR